MPSRSAQKLAAWVLSLGFAVLSVAYLNGAVFSAWVAGGSPNDNPLGWERRALGQLTLSVASMILSIGSYRLVSRLPEWSRSAIVILLLGVLVAMSPYFGRFVLQDKCLDNGGRWSNDQLVCIGARQ
jgi:hypothetical protein